MLEAEQEDLTPKTQQDLFWDPQNPTQEEEEEERRHWAPLRRHQETPPAPPSSPNLEGLSEEMRTLHVLAQPMKARMYATVEVCHRCPWDFAIKCECKREDVVRKRDDQGNIVLKKPKLKRCLSFVSFTPEVLAAMNQSQ